MSDDNTHRNGKLLRQARKIDAEAIYELLWEARKDIPIKDSFFENPNSKEWIEGYCKRRAVWIVELDGKIAGVMVMYAFEIFYLIVSSNYRRIGVGRTLIEQAKRYSINKRWNTLKAKANPNNTPIQNLLQQEEFVHNRGESDLTWNVYYWKIHR